MLKDKNIYAQHVNKALTNTSLGTLNRVCTIRDIINKYMTLHDPNTYIDVIPKLISNYNHTYHSGIRGTPANPYLYLIKKILDEKYRNAKMTETKYKIGHTVRYRLTRKMFDKGSSPSWSKTIHKVIAKIDTYLIIKNDICIMIFKGLEI